MAKFLLKRPAIVEKMPGKQRLTLTHGKFASRGERLLAVLVTPMA